MLETRYTLTCDHCGETEEVFDDFRRFTDDASAIATICRDVGWDTVNGAYHNQYPAGLFCLCPSCSQKWERLNDKTRLRFSRFLRRE